jgi:hypothetical protein
MGRGSVGSPMWERILSMVARSVMNAMSKKYDVAVYRLDSREIVDRVKENWSFLTLDNVDLTETPQSAVSGILRLSGCDVSSDERNADTRHGDCLRNFVVRRTNRWVR